MNKRITLACAAVAEAASARTSLLSVPLRIALLAVAALALAIAPMGAKAKADTTPKFSYTGSAYGTSVSVGSVVRSGPSALITLGCTTNGNLHKSNTTASVNLAPLVKTGTVSTTADTYAAPAMSKTTASTAQVNLLSGLVRATAIKAVSSTTRTPTGYALSSNGTTLTGLVVGGRTVRADAAPNTRINLAGFGHVIINEQIKQSSGLIVNGLHLYITATNPLGVAVGSNVIISQAVSGLSGPVVGVVGGYAYGSYANVGNVVLSGPSFPAYMPCLGTGGALRNNSGAAVNLGTVVKTGTISNSVRGTVTATSASGETTSTVQAVNLVNGLVKASVIKAHAHASTNGSSYNTSGTGSSFGSLTVAGHPQISADVAPNTKVVLPDVGTLYLNRVIRTNNAVTVVMIHLVLTKPVNGLAVGTDIKVAVATASIN